jgi:ribokinase
VTAPPSLTVVGSFVADLTFRAPRLPVWGESVFGSSCRISPGGKGSNQAIAAARLGAAVTLISCIGRDAFAEMARRTWDAERVDTRFVVDTTDEPTGAASVVVQEETGENAIVVVPGAGLALTCDDVDRARGAIADSRALLVQFELPMDVVRHALEVARGAGVTTILNPAPVPSAPVDPALFALCDYLTPNEAEAAALTAAPVTDLDAARRAAGRLRGLGAATVIVTLGDNGALIADAKGSRHVPAMDAGPVVETTGAGDAFNGALAVGLAEGMGVDEATRFACAAAGISVTRPGTSQSTATRGEVERIAGAPRQ